MSKTKNRILDTALRLFNEKGLSQVTLRTIASEMGISQGNLNYHYKKREDIIVALYFQLIEKIDARMEQSKSEKVDLSVLLDTSELIMTSLFQYRFILLDFVQVMRENEVIKKHFLELSNRRKDEFLFLFNALEKDGVMRKEQYKNEFLFLYQRIKIMGDFWISSAEVTYDRLTIDVLKEYAEVISLEMYPYLTEKGQKQLKDLLPLLERK